MTKKRNWKRIIPVIVVMAVFLILAAMQAVEAQAAPQHGFGQGQGRTDTINENDFHTAAWDRFSHNYQFTSGSDHRFDLGRPTQFNGFVPVDVFSVNMRRDANVSLHPPVYGIFSGHLPSHPVSNFFPQPVNPHFHQPIHISPTHWMPQFDTLQQGVNFQPQGNPMNIHTTGAPAVTNPSTNTNATFGNTGNSNGFLPPTSIGN